MSIINNTLLLGSGDEGYNLTRSLRFRSSASAYLSRTPASAGNRKTWTWSAWVKRGKLGSNQILFVSKPSATSDATFTTIGLSSSDTLLVSGYSVQWRNTTQVFRDPSAWYHIVVTWDTTQATASNRVKVYVNGSQVTAFGTTFDPSLNFDGAINQADAHYFCYPDGYSYSYFDGYLTDVNFIDGQALTPSSFGETDLITGVWKPKRYAGTYGTNGFYLPFTDNSALTTSSNAGLGKDFSGNGNYWTTNNISITSGVTYDSMTDVPTLTSATAANFAVLNPLDKTNGSVANGNLQFTYTSTSQGASVRSAVGMTSGKWYCEVTLSSYGGNNPMVGIIGIGENLGSTVDSYVGKYATGYAYILGNGGGISGHKINNTSSSAYGASTTTGDVIGLAFDADARTITFYKNNVSQGTAFSSIPAGTYCFAVSSLFSTVLDANFGQRPFAYTPPTGYVALNTYNLPTSTIVKGNTVMDATTWTGTSATQTITNSGFKPDLIWIKNRGVAVHHVLMDSVRGFTTGKKLESDGNYAEGDASEGQDWAGYVTGATSTGFTLDKSGTGANDYVHTSKSANTYVGWQWQAGQGTTSTNTSGSITSTVSVNASAGFSVASWTANGSVSTIGHGLGVKPSFVIHKPRTGTYDWAVITDILNGSLQYLYLNSTQAVNNTGWGTSPTSSVTSVYSYPNGTSMISYCFAPIAGYSAFGSYTGNGSTDGPFIYTGFRPKFVMVKVTSTTNWWIMFDSTRNPYNAANFELAANLSDAEYTANTSQYTLFDFLSNGFKLRTGSLEGNSNGQTYIYMAFAENPFKNALAR